MGDEFVDNSSYCVDGNSKPNTYIATSVGRKDSGVDSNETAATVDQRPAAVT
jgi:hypothetical protein